MQFALSSRPWETPHGYAITLDEQIRLAAAIGYRGIELRYPLIPPPEQWDAIKSSLERHGVEVVFAPCAGLPKDDESQRDALRVLDALQYLGGRFLKAIVFSPDDYPAMRRLADWAGERGIKVCTQLHVNTLSDTVSRTETCLRDLDHANIGLIFDAAHLPLSGDYDIDAAIHRLRPWTELLNIQSYATPSPANATRRRHGINGKEWVVAMPDERATVDLGAYLKGMDAAGFAGWATAMPAWEATLDGEDVAKAYHEFLCGLGVERAPYLGLPDSAVSWNLPLPARTAVSGGV